MATKERREELINRVERLGPVGESWAFNLKANTCPICGKAVNTNEIRDEISRKEFDLSHMCQKCQDEIFSPSDD